MSEKYTAGNYLIDRLKEVGIEHVFGVPGDYGFPFMDRIENDPGIAWIGACNELNAAYAADGYARVLGIAAVTGACGVLEMGVAGGIAGAYADEVPLLVISCFPEEAARGYVTHHSLRGRFDQYGAMMAPITASQTVLTAADAGAQIDQAIQDCWAAKAPVYIEFPRDVQELPAAPPASPLVLPEPQTDPSELERFLTHAVPMLRSAERPAILVDYMLARFGLTDPVQDLSAATGIPLATTLAGRSGVVDQTRPTYLGFYGSLVPTAEPSAVQRRIDASDVLIRVCVRPHDVNRGLADPALSDLRLIDLEADSATVGGTAYPNVSARDVLSRLRTELADLALEPVHTPATGPASFTPRPGVSITQDVLWQALTGFVEPDDAIAVDYGTVQAVSMLDFPVRTQALTQSSWNAIGWTSPAVVGAQLADPGRRYVQIVGDGGFQETALEISTTIRLRLAPITILLNNGTYQVENVTHANRPVDRAYNRLQGWDYSQLPAVFGSGEKPLGVRVRTEDELAAALDAAAAAHREGCYSLIEVVVAPDDVATAFADFIGLSPMR